jgi:hypothetical protein
MQKLQQASDSANWVALPALPKRNNNHHTEMTHKTEVLKDNKKRRLGAMLAVCFWKL